MNTNELLTCWRQERVWRDAGLAVRRRGLSLEIQATPGGDWTRLSSGMVLRVAAKLDGSRTLAEAARLAAE